MKPIIVVLMSLTTILLSCNAGKKEKKVNPQAMALYEQATDFEVQSKPDSALLFYDRAIKADPTYHIPYFGKANLLVRENEFHKAMEAIETAVEKEPTFAEGWQSAGFIADLIGDTLKASEYYKESIRLFNKNISESDNPDVIQGNRFNKIVSLTMLAQDEELEKETRLFKEENPDISNLDQIEKMNREELLQNIITVINQ